MGVSYETILSSNAKEIQSVILPPNSGCERLQQFKNSSGFFVGPFATYKFRESIVLQVISLIELQKMSQQQKQAQDNPNQMPMADNGAGMGQAQQMAGVNKHGSRSTSPNAVLDQKNAMGMGMMPNAGMAGATPEQLQAMAAANLQQQQLAMNPFALQQQMQQLQLMQQLQQQNLSSSLQGLPAGFQMPGNETSAGQQNQGAPQNQMQQQLLQHQQLLQAQQAAMLQQYNPMMGLTAPQQQLLNQGYGLPQNSMTAQQLQQLYQQPPFGQTTPHLNINGMAAPHQFGASRQGPHDQQNILNINITPHGQLASQRSPKEKQKDYMLMEDTKSKEILDNQDLHRDLSAPRQQSKMTVLNVKENIRNAKSRPRRHNDQQRSGDSKDSPRKDGKSKSRGRKGTFIANNLAKETKASQMKYGGKLSVKTSIQRQIQYLSNLEDSLKVQKRAQASQSRSPPRPDGMNFDPAALGQQQPNPQQLAQLEQMQQQQLLYNQFLQQQAASQQYQGGFPNMLGQQPNQFMPPSVDQNRRMTFEANPALIEQERAQYPSTQQVMETPQIKAEEPPVIHPQQMGSSMKSKHSKISKISPKLNSNRSNDRQKSRERESWDKEINARQISGPIPANNIPQDIVGETRMFDKPPSQPTTARKMSQDKEPTPRSQRQSERRSRQSSNKQKQLSERMSKPVSRVSQQPEPKPFERISQHASDKRQPTPPKSDPRVPSSQRSGQKKSTPRVPSDQRSKRTSSNKNVIQSNVEAQPVSVEIPLDQEAIDKLMREEASLEAAMKIDQDERTLNQKAVDELIQQEEEFQLTMKQQQLKVESEPDPVPVPQLEERAIDPLDEAKELFGQEIQPIQSQPSMTSSKKLKIKVSSEQKKMLTSQQSWKSKKSVKLEEQPSQNLDDLAAEINAIAPQVPEPSMQEQMPEASLKDIEKELQEVVNADVQPIQQSSQAPKSSIPQPEPSIKDMNLADIENEINQQPIPKSDIMPEHRPSKIEAAPSAKPSVMDHVSENQLPQISDKQPFDQQRVSEMPPMASQKDTPLEQVDVAPRATVDQPPHTKLSDLKDDVKEPSMKEPSLMQPSLKEPSLKAPSLQEPSLKEQVPEPASENLFQPIQDDEPPAMEPEEPLVVMDLADTKCLPFFESFVKTKQEIIAMEVDETEDTDGYLSEDIDKKKSQIGLFNSSQVEEKQQEVEKQESKVKKQSTAGGSDKNEKIRKMKEKEREKKKKDDDDGSDKSDQDKKKPEPPIRENYEKMSHEEIQKQMYLSQRGLLYQVRGLQQKKGHKFLIQSDSENNLYQYLQEFREEVEIDRSGIFEINHPNKIYFEIFVIILAIYNCFGIPLEICFQPVTMEATEFVVLNSIIDFIFGVDIYVQFKTTFYDPLSGDEVFDKSIIFWTYLKGRFVVDFMATVPFDNITYAITQKRISILPLFSLLKLIRITRLGRIIERMNVREHIKLMMKLSQIIFMLIMFIHCQACAWFYIVSLTKDWTAPLDGIDPNNDLYNDSTVRKYLISVYYSILLLTCNDITPKGQWKIFFCAASVTLGAIINSIIFGNMALIIQNLNQKNSEFQESIDLANTAMKNMDMPKELQQDVVSYLQYTQQSQNGQQEFEYFYQCLSPSLRNEVIQYIFKTITQECPLFDQNENLIDFFIKSLELMLLDPEYPLVSQGEKDNQFFFIKQGECEVFVKDPIKKRDQLVRTLRNGNFFGEGSLLTRRPRSASVRPKSYAMIGFFHEQKFEEMVFMFPEVRSSLQKHFFEYDDLNRQWQREQLKNIQYLTYLEKKTLDELTIILSNDILDENQEIFKEGQVPDKVYILARGKIELFLSIPEGELVLDTVTEPGSVFAQISILKRQKMTYSARAAEDSEILSISYEKLQEYRALNHMADLNTRIDQYFEAVINPLDLKDKLNLIGFLDYNKKRPKSLKKLTSADRNKIWQSVIDRQVMICRFQLKKDNILTDLIAELKKISMDDEQKSKNKMKELVKSIAPIIVSKLKKLVSNRIKQVHQESMKQNQSIKNIHSIIQLINDQHKQKQQSLPAEKKGKVKKSSSNDEDKKSDKSPSKYKGAAGLQKVDEQDEEGSEESIDLTENEGDY